MAVKKPRIGLDRDKVLLWTAILGLLKEVAEIVIETVSYDCEHSELCLPL